METFVLHVVRSLFLVFTYIYLVKLSEICDVYSWEDIAEYTLGDKGIGSYFKIRFDQSNQMHVSTFFSLFQR